METLRQAYVADMNRIASEHVPSAVTEVPGLRHRERGQAVPLAQTLRSSPRVAHAIGHTAGGVRVGRVGSAEAWVVVLPGSEFDNALHGPASDHRVDGRRCLA